jgi:hypothetical protein
MRIKQGLFRLWVVAYVAWAVFAALAVYDDRQATMEMFERDMHESNGWSVLPVEYMLFSCDTIKQPKQQPAQQNLTQEEAAFEALGNPFDIGDSLLECSPRYITIASVVALPPIALLVFAYLVLVTTRWVREGFKE